MRLHFANLSQLVFISQDKLNILFLALDKFFVPLLVTSSIDLEKGSRSLRNPGLYKVHSGLPNTNNPRLAIL